MIPFVGNLINTFVVILSQYTTKYEAAADFLAEDLEQGNDEYIGLRVAMRGKPKLKDD